MSRPALLISLALVGCVQPSSPWPPPAPPQPSYPQPAPPVIVGEQPPSPSRAPRYPSWNEVASSPPVASTGPSHAVSGGTPLIGGASLHKTSAGSVDFEVVLFDSRSHALKVLDQPEDWSGGGKIAECMRKAGAVAGVNGGFFTPQFTPMGVMVAEGRSTGSWQANKLLTGAVVVHGGTPRLFWNAEARGALQGASQFLQAGPRLVDGGRAVPSLERAKHTTRTFIATDGGTRWLFGLARGTSLGELADALASNEIIPGFRIQRALNLDGGRSSALYYRTADGQEHSDPGWSTVRNYLGIVPR